MNTHLSTRPHRVLVPFAGALLVAALAAGAAQGGISHRPRTTVTDHVFYGDLDLSRPHDALRMMIRIQAAAERACALPRTGALPGVPAEVWRCREAAVKRAVASLNAPLVSAEYARLRRADETQTAAR